MGGAIELWCGCGIPNISIGFVFVWLIGSVSQIKLNNLWCGRILSVAVYRVSLEVWFTRSLSHNEVDVIERVCSSVECGKEYGNSVGIGIYLRNHYRVRGG